MKDKNGIDTVSALRQRNNNTHVIFASSYKDVVFDSLKVKTFRFLIKPIEKEKLYEALNSLIREKATALLYWFVIQNSQLITVYLNGILFLHRLKMYPHWFMHLINAINMRTLFQLFKKNYPVIFLQITSLFLVNMKYITNYSKMRSFFHRWKSVTV